MRIEAKLLLSLSSMSTSALSKTSSDSFQDLKESFVSSLGL
jgi:hypothetical protein